MAQAVVEGLQHPTSSAFPHESQDTCIPTWVPAEVGVPRPGEELQYGMSKTFPLVGHEKRIPAWAPADVEVASPEAELLPPSLPILKKEKK